MTKVATLRREAMTLLLVLAITVASPVLHGFDVLADPAAAQAPAAGPPLDSPEAVWDQVKKDSKNAWDEASGVSQKAWKDASDESTRLWNQATDEETWRKAQKDSEELWLKAKRQSQTAWDKAADSSQRAWESTKDFTQRSWDKAKSSVTGAPAASGPPVAGSMRGAQRRG